MVYPEDGRRIVKIRKNHRGYKNGHRKKRAVWFTIIGVLFAGLLAAGYYFELPSKMVELWSGIREQMSAAAMSGEPETPEEADAAEMPKEDAAAADEPEVTPTTVIFTGDIWLDPAVQENYDGTGIDGVTDDGLLAALTEADICAINNEFAFSTQGQQAEKQYTYRVDPKYVTILNDLGVDVAGLANNHALDFGTTALSDTFTALDDAGIRRIGAGMNLAEAAAPAVMEVNGETFAFIAATHVIPEVSWNVRNRQPGMLAFYDEKDLLDAVTAAAEAYDHVYVLAHWGSMRTTELESYQINDGHLIIDAGAEAVIGAHPHVLQGIESYNGGYIFYSLGDFISTNTIDQTMAVTFTYNGDETKVRIVPATCANYRTVSADGAKAAGIYDLLRGISGTVAIDAEGYVTAQ